MGLQAELCQKCGSLFFSGNNCGCARGMSRLPAATPPPRAPQPSATTAGAEAVKASTPPTFDAEDTLDESLPATAPVRAVQSAPIPDRTLTPPDTSSSTVTQLSFHGSGGALLGIHVINMFLSLVTLGIYYFWGKVKVRHFLFSQSEFNGDRFAYHGTGKELFFGFLRAAVAIGGISLLFRAVPHLPGVALKVGVILLAYGTLFVFIPFAIAASRRYRMSRASWRGIRFSFRGSVGDFIRLYLTGIGLTVLTLGFYYPYFVARQQQFLVSHTYFGNEPFDFDGNGRELFKIYLPIMVLPILGFVLAIVVPNLMRILGSSSSILNGLALLPILIFSLVGVGWFWFQAARQRYIWNHTIFGNARLHSTVTGGRYFLLKLGNALLLVLTLGLAWPWVIIRDLKFTFHHLTLEGALDLEAIQQEAQSATAVGEGFDTLMELDTGFAA